MFRRPSNLRFWTAGLIMLFVTVAAAGASAVCGGGEETQKLVGARLNAAQAANANTTPELVSPAVKPGQNLATRPAAGNQSTSPVVRAEAADSATTPVVTQSTGATVIEFQPDRQTNARVVSPFLRAHCLRCHGPETQEADFRVDAQLSNNFLDRTVTEKWGEVLNMPNAGDMPPDGPPCAAGPLSGLLKATKEGDGDMLDNTLVLYGSGMNNGKGGGHSPKNLPLPLAGGRNLGIKQGQHLRFETGSTPMSNLLLRCCRQWASSSASSWTARERLPD